MSELRYIRLGNGMDIDIFNPPENLEELVQMEFALYTRGTSSDYTDEDRLRFIDVTIERLHCADSYYAVKDLIMERYEYELDDQGRLMDSDEFYNMEFMECCYERGREDASLRYHCDDHHVYDKVNRLIARIIRAVMTWEHPKEAEG